MLCTTALLISSTSCGYDCVSFDRERRLLAIGLAILYRRPCLAVPAISLFSIHYNNDCYPLPTSLSCNSISSFLNPPLPLPPAFTFIHAISVSRSCCSCALYENERFVPSAVSRGVAAQFPSKVLSDVILFGRGHARSKASGSPYRLFPKDLGPMATCFQWLGRSHLKNGPRVGMQAAMRAK